MLALGPIILLQATAPGTSDIETVIAPPTGATGFLFAAMGCQTNAGVQKAVGCELSWVDPEVSGSYSTSNYRIPLVRDRATTPTIDSYYYAGLNGFGEPVRQSSQGGGLMRLYIFVDASSLVATDSAYVRIQWATEGCEP